MEQGDYINTVGPIRIGEGEGKGHMGQWGRHGLGDFQVAVSIRDWQGTFRKKGQGCLNSRVALTVRKGQKKGQGIA